MLTFSEYLTELSKRTLNTYLDKSAEQRKSLSAAGDTEKVKKRLTGANVAVNKLQAKMDKQRQGM
jgi:hypothetical protein